MLPSREQRFELPATVTLMSLEYEHRYLVRPEAAQQVLAVAHRHLDVEVHDPRRPIAYARTVYFDNDALAYLHSFEQGDFLRLRARQYAQARDLVDPPRVSTPVFLELKRSTGTRRQKTRVPLSPEQADWLFGGPRTGELERVLRDRGLADVAERMHESVLSPRMMTWYRRLSLSSRRLRITFDEAIAYCAPEPMLAIGKPAEPACAMLREPSAVLEIKTQVCLPGWLRRCLVNVPETVDHSKFRAGMGRLGQSEGRPDKATLPLPILR